MWLVFGKNLMPHSAKLKKIIGLIAYIQNASNLEVPLYRGCPYKKPDFCKINTFANRSYLDVLVLIVCSLNNVSFMPKASICQCFYNHISSSAASGNSNEFKIDQKLENVKKSFVNWSKIRKCQKILWSIWSCKMRQQKVDLLKEFICKYPIILVQIWRDNKQPISVQTKFPFVLPKIGIIVAQKQAVKLKYTIM